MRITVTVCQNLNRLRDHITEPLKVKLKTWKAKNVDPYTGKQYELSKKNLAQYKQNVSTVKTKQGDIEFLESLSDNVHKLVGDYERINNRLNDYQGNYIHKKVVEDFINILDKYKIVDLQMNIPEDGLRRAQNKILLKEVKKLVSQLEK